MAEERATLVIRIKRIGAKSLKSVASGLKSIGAIAAVAATAIVAFVGKSLAAFRVQELAVNKLNQSLVQQGIFTKELSDEYQNMASALQKVTTFGDEAIISAQAQLQAYLGQTKVTKETLEATLDFASAMGVDLKVAADLVGKTVGSTTNALSRYGITVDTAGTKSQKLAAVTKALNDRFGGQSEAAASGTGAIIQMNNALGDVMEIIGKAFAPLIIEISKRITTFAEDIQTGKESLSGLVEVAKFVAKTFAILKNGTILLGKIIGTGLATAVEAVTAATQLQFSKAKDIVMAGGAELKKITLESAQATADDLALINDKVQLEAEVKADNSAALVRSSAIRNRQIKAEEAEKDSIQAEEISLSEFEAETERIGANNEQLLALDLQKKESEISAATTHAERLKLLGDKQAILDKQRDLKKTAFEAQQQKEREANQKQALGRIAGLQNSSNKTLAAIGKAAALTQIAIAAPQGISKALAAFPPPLNFVAAGAVGAAFAAQAANVAGVKLADGGIVNPTRGGTSATIGEGGRAEAVIPLPDDFDADEGGLGGAVNITFTGPILGDEAQALEFARVVDRGLLELRRGNESKAFDEGLV